MLTDRERKTREFMRKEKQERWRDIQAKIRDRHVDGWLEFWAGHWPPDKTDCLYLFGRKGDNHLYRHLRIEVHYLKQSRERQFQYEQMFIV